MLRAHSLASLSCEAHRAADSALCSSESAWESGQRCSCRPRASKRRCSSAMADCRPDTRSRSSCNVRAPHVERDLTLTPMELTASSKRSSSACISFSTADHSRPGPDI
ncbi:unnamed protein product, partial [Ixodes pacificus]